MKCRDLMKTDIECVNDSDSIQEAARKMRDANIGFLPVCDKDMKPLGTLTDRDITIRLVAEKKSLDSKVKEIMTNEVISVNADDDLEEAEDLMGQHHVARMLCCDDDGKLIGVISLSDIVQQEQADKAAQTMKDVTEREAHV